LEGVCRLLAEAGAQTPLGAGYALSNFAISSADRSCGGQRMRRTRQPLDRSDVREAA
jgi:hypothetical protein